MSGERFVRVVDAAGVPTFHRLPEGAAVPVGGVAVDRLPGPFEDFVGGQWVTDHRGLADWRAGAAHIAEARAIKFIEAQLVLAGVALPDGLLAAEAAAMDLTVQALAAAVIGKRQEFKAAEVARQLGQAGKRKD